MSTSAATAGSDTVQDVPYTSEIRFGVVMYGGVSLAIYINGVANELYEMACATPKTDERSGCGTRDVYRKASWLLGSDRLRQRYLDHLNNPETPDPFGDATALEGAQRTRFVVDTISGTSAGGINGAFLAKALANGQDFAPLKTLWIEEGAIEKLLNDKHSYDDMRYAKADKPPQSLLNSDRMYIKLLDAFRSMESVIKPRGKSESALVDEIDLYMTTTDIRGAVVPLRLFDKVVYEKRFKQVYHFQYKAADGCASLNDFKDENAPFLAFAARCTSSFPFAFEPMCVSDAQRLCKVHPGIENVEFSEWQPFFTGLSSEDISKGRWINRAFGDGGYLDNKPFSYVVNALSWRLGGLPMERKLIFVDPAPEHPETERQDFDTKPDAFENAFAALSTIPQYETIREDLEAILTRNRRIERVERIVREVENDIETSPVDPFRRIQLTDGKVPDWSSLDMSDMIRYYGTAFLPYRRLRMMTVTDDIAERLAVWWGIDRGSDQLYALKAMARVWREQRYYENRPARGDGRTESVNAFLNAFDVKYRLRRTGFLLRKVHQLIDVATKLRESNGAAPRWSDIEQRLLQRIDRRMRLSEMNLEAVIDALNCLAHGFGNSMGELRAAAWAEAPDNPKAADSRKESFGTLDYLLGFLLGEKSDSKFEVLAASEKETVPLPADLPPPSPLRTLQENVFERARALFSRAASAPRTKIQDLLEADIDELRKIYARVIGISSERKFPLVRELLGKPKLVPSSIDANGGTDQPTVIIHVDDAVEGVGAEKLDALNTKEGKRLRDFLAEYYLRFDEYDQMSFPLYYDTGTGEPATVEVLRISPEDAPSLMGERGAQGATSDARRKLAGTALFHFGAFLDAQWRRNDMMWGRLDGCERLLAALFPEDKDKAIREALLQEAQRVILREEMQPDGYAKLVDGFVKTLAAQSTATLNQAFNGLWAQLAPTDPQRRTRMAQALKAVLGDSGLIGYVRKDYEVNRELDSKATLHTGARALTITGQILEESEKRYRGHASRTVWITRAGRAANTLFAISTPGSLNQAVFRHWLALLYAFEAFIVAGAVIFSAPTLRTFGLTSLGLTVALHLASLIAGDLMYRRRAWLKLAAALLGAGVLALAFLGALAWHNGGLASILCAGSNRNLFLQVACSCIDAISGLRH
jgi:patatin-related protein